MFLVTLIDQFVWLFVSNITHKAINRLPWNCTEGVSGGKSKN